MVRLVAAGVVLLGWSVGLGQGAPAAGTGAKRPMTFADLMAMKRVSDPQISPSGKWVLFSVTEVSLEKNSKVNHLWVVPLAGGGERQVTFGTGESFGRFSPDGRLVSFTAVPTSQDAVGRIAVAKWDESAGAMETVRTLRDVSGDADGAIWSPDSKHLLFTTAVYPECSERGSWAEEDACDVAKDQAASGSPVKAQVFTGLLYRHWNAFSGEKRTHILEADIGPSGANPRDLTPRSAVGDAETPTFSLGGPLGYAWAPDSKEIAYVTNLDKVKAASTNNDVFTLRLDEAGARPVKVSTSLGSDDGPAYSPDGRWLAFRSQARAGYESDRFRLMVFDREKGAAKEQFDVPDLDGVDEFVWSKDASKLYFTSPYHGSIEILELLLNARDATWIASSPEFSDLVSFRNGVVAISMNVDNPAEVVVFDLGDPRSESGKRFAALGKSINTIERSDGPIRGEYRLSHLNDGLLTDLNLTKMESYWFDGAEGAKVQGFIVKPPDFDPKKKYPVKFLIHGGPQGAWGDAWSYRWNPELMAASGYVVVMVNPRGSTGYGQAFIDGVNGDWGGKAYVDLMKGLDAAEAQFPFIDKTRECALGGSYGGYMANWMLTHTNRFKCIVSHDGMYNPAAAYGDTEEMWFNEWEFRRPGDKEPGQPWRYSSLPAEQDPFRKWSPMLHIQDAKTPTLVIHSQKDYRLDVSEGFQLFTALQRLGVPSEMLYFPDEGHWVLKPKNAELWNKTVGDWCDRWTKTGAFAAAR
jgi:dipeptidyl aminopeptidase/acylaminoacyl peptidase